MSANSFMHPRNIYYQNPPNFAQLAIEFPEFGRFTNLELNGKIKINFKNQETLRVLTKCLLKKDFGLDVKLPENKLIPTLTLRLNYILWIEDILNTFNIRENIKGIDIGCGASCIYALLGAKLNNWQMIASETNVDSVATALENVTNNQLQNLVTVKKQDCENQIFKNLLNHSTVDFCMCNPPFFKCDDDLDNNSAKNNRTGRRGEPNNAKSGSLDELVVEGGELEFVQRMIEESLLTCDKIKVYTTMLGHKNSVAKVVKILSAQRIHNYTTTEFCQGHTIRWGVAWTFMPNLYLRKVPVYGQNIISNKILSHSFTSDLADLSEVLRLLQQIFADINIELQNIQFLNENALNCNIIAVANTWSNQRRKRRQLHFQNLNNPQIENKINKKIETILTQADENKAKKFKADNELEIEKKDQIPMLVVDLSVRKVQNEVLLNLEYLCGLAEKDGTYQLLQFLINRLK